MESDWLVWFSSLDSFCLTMTGFLACLVLKNCVIDLGGGVHTINASMYLCFILIFTSYYFVLPDLVCIMPRSYRFAMLKRQNQKNLYIHT